MRLGKVKCIMGNGKWEMPRRGEPIVAPGETPGGKINNIKSPLPWKAWIRRNFDGMGGVGGGPDKNKNRE